MKTDSDFWNDLEAKFRALSDSAPLLTGIFEDGSSSWQVIDREQHVSVQAMRQFDQLASRGAAVTGWTTGDSGCDHWLNLIRTKKPQLSNGGIIKNLAEVSADYCFELGTLARKSQADEGIAEPDSEMERLNNRSAATLEKASGHPDGATRRARVESFLKDASEAAGRKITRKDIWRLAGHKTSRQFEYWQANNSKATAQGDQNFRRILAMSSSEFLKLLQNRA